MTPPGMAYGRTPLLRSMAALSKEGARLCKNLGYDIGGVQPNIGLEQASEP